VPEQRKIKGESCEFHAPDREKKRGRELPDDTKLDGDSLPRGGGLVAFGSGTRVNAKPKYVLDGVDAWRQVKGGQIVPGRVG